MKLTVLKNKKTGQVSINIPKGMAELYKIDNKTEISIEPKNNNEFTLKIKR
ncbi:MAG: hypothetical protein QT00_C0002G0481 [archaeon GW2011_AR5]|nr:MAG: hypothetical protein QT00_C0002G0481 [archaeon GW2011_AR5]